jgi:hypothetical protein
MAILTLNTFLFFIEIIMRYYIFDCFDNIYSIKKLEYYFKKRKPGKETLRKIIIL